MHEKKMPISSVDLEDAKRLYTETVPRLTETREKAADLSKVISKQKKIFRNYMKQQNLTELKIGDTTFRLEQDEKVQCSLKLVESFFPTELVNEFKTRNKKRKMKFSQS